MRCNFGSQDFSRSTRRFFGFPVEAAKAVIARHFCFSKLGSEAANKKVKLLLVSEGQS